MGSSITLRASLVGKLALVGALIAGLLSAPVVPPRPVAAQERTSRPNIVVIMTDDQTVESLRVMPAVRRLLKTQGTKFTRSFATYPLCCPSRASFLTGQYSHNNGVTFNYAPYGGWQAFENAAPTAFPVALQQAGYDTAHFGKVMNEYGAEDPTEVPPGWSHWEAMVDRPARNRYYGFRFNRNGKVRSAAASGRNYNTDFFARRARRYIKSRTDQTSPFFLNLWLFGPHGESGNGPAIPADRHVGVFADEPLPSTPSMNEADLSDKPIHLQRPRLSSKQIARARRLYRWRLESLLAVDDAVEDLVATLRDTGTLDNTLVVFTSDNGFLHGEHRIPIGKWHVYDEATRVPLLMRGPKIPAGRLVGEPVANIDVGPTLLDYAGATPLNVQDGRSLRPLITGETKTFDRDLLLTTGYGKADRWYTAIRTKEYLYIEHVQDPKGDQIIGEELYDLTHDPHQLHSLHADPSFEATRAALQERLQRLRACRGETCQSRAQLPLADGGGERVPRSQIETAGPVDDPESYPAYFSTYQETEPTPEPDASDVATSLRVTRADTTAGPTTFTSDVTVDGQPAPGVPVTLRRRTTGTKPLIDVASTVTDAKGVATFTVDNSASATWRARVEPTEDRRSARSADRELTVSPAITTRVTDRQVEAGTRVTFTGTVSPQRRGQTVTLQRRVDGRWEDVKETSLDAASTYRFHIRAGDDTTDYRVHKDATRTLRSGSGEVRRITGYRLRLPRLEANPPGADARQFNGEYVVVRNRGLAGVQLAGWTLRARSSGVTYILPRYRLQPGAKVRIHSGKSAREAGSIFLRAGAPVWANHDDRALLFDRDGHLADATP